MTEEEELERFMDNARKQVEGINESAMFLQIWHEAMATELKENPWPAIQFGIAIMLGKPILVLTTKDRPIPERIARIADRIVVVDKIETSKEEITKAILEFTKEIEQRAQEV